ncbi:MAG: TetR family transcriptional regulator C-terminal domain-containing protein [Synergistaceae bacterium]|nr:TetR family transcriptional regulator C-terminal domain-containing protein [Synergistaceae bacterium]MBR0079294.1 TetR family transcriptional regulator C-terminal domain-containing protein [Synergistaceae bacterium]
MLMWIYAEPVKNIIFRIGDVDYSFRKALIANLNYFAENRKYFINALTNTLGQNSFLNHVFKINFELLCDFIKSSRKIKTFPPRIEALIKLYVFGTVQFVCDWLINNMPIQIEEFADILEAGLPEEIKTYLYKT